MGTTTARCRIQISPTSTSRPPRALRPPASSRRRETRRARRSLGASVLSTALRVELVRELARSRSDNSARLCAACSPSGAPGPAAPSRPPAPPFFPAKAENVSRSPPASYLSARAPSLSPSRPDCTGEATTSKEQNSTTPACASGLSPPMECTCTKLASHPSARLLTPSPPSLLHTLSHPAAAAATATSRQAHMVSWERRKAIDNDDVDGGAADEEDGVRCRLSGERAGTILSTRWTSWAAPSGTT